MRRSEQKSSNRSMLFTKLATLEQAGLTWDRIFEMVAQDTPPVFRGKLEKLAADLRLAKAPMAELLRQSQLFLPWEMSIMLIGLGVGKSQATFTRLSQHYDSLARAWSTFRTQLLGPLALLLPASFLGPWARMQQDPLPSTWFYMLEGLAPTLLVLLLLWLGLGAVHKAQRAFTHSLLPRSFTWLPPLHALNVSNSLYHYMMNLALCIEAGLPLHQSLQLGAKAESEPYMRGRYEKVTLAVQGGKSLSQAFKSSGLLTETRLVGEAKVGETSGALDSAQARIAAIVKSSFDSQLMFLARWLPRSLYLLIPIVWFF